MRMSLGNYTFARNPNRCGLLTPVRHTASVQTYGGVAFFSWGLMTKGKQVRLDWDLCENAQYDSMQSIYVADASVLWNPKDGSGKSYSVEVTGCDGQLFMYLKAKNHWVKNVYLDLLILDEGTVL